MIDLKTFKSLNNVIKLHMLQMRAMLTKLNVSGAVVARNARCVISATSCCVSNTRRAVFVWSNYFRLPTISSNTTWIRFFPLVLSKSFLYTQGTGSQQLLASRLTYSVWSFVAVLKARVSYRPSAVLSATRCTVPLSQRVRCNRTLLYVATCLYRVISR